MEERLKMFGSSPLRRRFVSLAAMALALKAAPALAIDLPVSYNVTDLSLRKAVTGVVNAPETLPVFI